MFQSRPLHSGLHVLPVIYILCVSFNVFAIIYEGSECEFTSFNICITS